MIKVIVDMYKEFISQLKKNPAITIYTSPVRKVTPIAIEKCEHELSIGLPEDYRAFLLYYDMELSGTPVIKKEKTFFSLGFDFLTIPLLKQEYRTFSAKAKRYDEDVYPLHYRLYSEGIPLTYSEPRLVYLPGGDKYSGIYLIDPEHNEKLNPITPTFTDFFKYYFSAGCFSAHNFYYYWEYVRSMIPFGILPKENKWLIYYNRIYGNRYKIY